MASAARGLVEKLDGQGWLRRDAIHAAAKAFRIAGEKGVPVTKMKIETPKCSCGKPLPDRANAATCGDSKCRMKLHRRRLRVERVRARVQDLFSRLLAERHRPFTADHARALGAGLRLRPRAVNKLLRELVEDGNASVGTDSADVYLLAPPHVHLAA